MQCPNDLTYPQHLIYYWNLALVSWVGTGTWSSPEEKKSQRGVSRENWEMSILCVPCFSECMMTATSGAEKAISGWHNQSQKWTWPWASTFPKRTPSPACRAPSRLTASLFPTFWVLMKRGRVGRSPTASPSGAHRWQHHGVGSQGQPQDTPLGSWAFSILAFLFSFPVSLFHC